MHDKQASYRKKIVKHLYFAGSLSCADLSILTKKSVPLTTRVLNDLMEEGYVMETGLASSTGGRRPQTYSLRKEWMFIVSVAMDQLITRMAIMDMHNNCVGSIELAEINLTDNIQSLARLKEVIDSFIHRSGIPKHRIIGIGIGMPGFVDITKGVNHSFLKTSEESIITYLESQVGLPVYIDNDSSVIALAEQRLGAARNRQNVMVINISWGIGLGMILKGELFRGYNGFAGEFSHIPVFMNNKMCSCGKSGCLETETSLLVLAEKAIKGIRQGRMSLMKDLSQHHIEETIQRIMDAANNGDKFAVELFSDEGYNIGRGIAILIHLLNPELIVLSGRGAEAGKLWLPPVQQAINEHCIPKIAENTEVVVSTLRFQAGLIGAAALVMEHFEKGIHNHLFNKNEKVA